MKIRIEDIKESARSVAFAENVGEVNELLARSSPVDYQYRRPVEVTVRYYRAGEDLFFEGRLAGKLSGNCARCLESYPFEIGRDFRFVLKPAPSGTSRPTAADEDVSLSFYGGEEVDLSPLVREELILGLPTRPLCRESCSGLCPRCGKNRNDSSCDCTEEWLDPRLAPLRALKLR